MPPLCSTGDVTTGCPAAALRNHACPATAIVTPGWLLAVIFPDRSVIWSREKSSSILSVFTRSATVAGALS